MCVCMSVCKCDECSFFNYCINMDYESVNKDLLLHISLHLCIHLLLNLTLLRHAFLCIFFCLGFEEVLISF